MGDATSLGGMTDNTTRLDHVVLWVHDPVASADVATPENPGQRMSLTLSCDHRVVDGAVGARLLQAIVAILERPITLAF